MGWLHKHVYTSDKVHEEICLVLGSRSCVWALQTEGLLFLYKNRRSPVELPLMCFDSDSEQTAVVERLNALEEEGGEVHLVEVNDPLGRCYGFFATEIGTYVKPSFGFV